MHGKALGIGKGEATMHKTLTALGLAALMVLSTWSLLFSQDDMKTLADPAFGQRAPGACPPSSTTSTT